MGRHADSARSHISSPSMSKCCHRQSL